MSILHQDIVELEPIVVDAMVRSGEAVLVDVREEEEFAEERVDGALLLPMSEFEVEQLPQVEGKKTILMCLGGVRSAAVAQRVLRAGRPVAVHLKGGLNAWKDAGLPVLTTD